MAFDPPYNTDLCLHHFNIMITGLVTGPLIDGTHGKSFIHV